MHVLIAPCFAVKASHCADEKCHKKTLISESKRPRRCHLLVTDEARSTGEWSETYVSVVGTASEGLGDE